ncbi:ParB/RepB/Spo0J family partition protein, partial [Streptomyces sp. PSKA30]
MSQQPVVEVEIGSLSLSGSPRLGGERPEHIQLLAAAQKPLPPITVHRPTMRVIDGYHRLKAARLRGERTIAARFFDGDEAAAFVLAVKLNVTHGLPLALADRKRAAERIVVSHPQWSDRRVASVTGIAPGTVGEIRRRVV